MVQPILSPPRNRIDILDSLLGITLLDILLINIPFLPYGVAVEKPHLLAAASFYKRGDRGCSEKACSSLMS